MTDDPRAKWNARYAGRGQLPFERPPSDWVTEHRGLIAGRLPGRALDVACGGGRNAFFLAEMGFEVDAIDVSDVAIEGVARTASRRDLDVTAIRADLEVVSFPRPPYRVVLVLNYLQRSLFANLADALDPGGLVVFETWSDDRSRPRFSLRPGELRAAFAGLEVLAYREDPEARRAGIVARRTY